MLRFRVETPGMKLATSRLQGEIPRGIQKRIDEGARQTAKVALGRARDYAPKRTGRLAKSLYVGKEGPMRYYVTSRLKYYPYVILGTRPHIIRPRHKKALYWPGARHPVAIVHHPGTKPNDFMDKALRGSYLDMVFKRIIEQLQRLWDELSLQS